LSRLHTTRVVVAAARTAVERQVLALRHGDVLRPGGRVLCYHAVGSAPPAWGRSNCVSLERFETQLVLALALGFRFVPAAHIGRHGQSGSRDLAVTFDDGLKSVLNAEPLLRRLGIPWTLFVVTDWVEGAHGFGADALLDWSEIEALHARGVTIGSHSRTHPNFACLDAAAEIDELVYSRATLADHLGSPPDAFAIPFGQSRDWSSTAHSAALAAGYTDIYAQSERRRPAETRPRTFVTGFDDARLFRAALWGAFDDWEEWY
jgi:peptidoglycan/xylan/chitin deacetylase (PgdA/CDA1 family)